MQNLLQNLHRQLWRDGAAGDELVQRVGEGHANATELCGDLSLTK